MKLKPGAKVLAADDSGVARSLIEQSLTAMGVPFVMTKTGQEAWNVLQSRAEKGAGRRHAISPTRSRSS